MADDLAARFAATAFSLSFRRYQEVALAAFERARADGDRRISLAMPPGSGKTLLGLEIARRLGRPVLILAPTTAIVGQWVAQWGSFMPPTVEAAADADRAAPITAITYQALCVLDHASDEAPDEGTDDPDDDPEPGRAERSRRRRLIARGGDRDEVLSLLHANGRALVTRFTAAGPITLILDECHHLIQLWGHLLETIIDELHPDAVVVGLTATPPDGLGDREAALYRRLFGATADFQVVAPAVVRDGFLAPYQELALLTRPLPEESRFVAGIQARFARLLTDVMDPGTGSLPFLVWLDRRVDLRRSDEGTQVGWATIEADDPELARSALRLRWQRGLPPPEGARYREQHRQVPEMADWMALLGPWVHEVLEASGDAQDRKLRERIRMALPSVGYQLTRTRIRATASVIDRVLARSGSKPLGAVRILRAEHAALGERLRALVLCDHEVAGRRVGARLQGVLDPAAGSAALALRTFLGHPDVAGLDPLLVSGRSVACSRDTARALVAFAAADPVAGPILVGFDVLGTAGATPERPPEWGDAVLIDPPDPAWTPRTWVPLVTRFFVAGGSRCLIGTRALLGEGWDAPPVNVLVDLTVATTRIAVHQMRGRGLRLDPRAPDKVTDDWDVVCVAPDHLGGTADYDRFVRKHRAWYGLTSAGEIESGVSHVDPRLTPFEPPSDALTAELEATMLARPADRARVRSGWRIGEPYQDVEAETVRVRLGRSPGLPEVGLLRAHTRDRTPPRLRVGVLAGVVLGGLALAGGWLAGSLVPGLLGAVAVLALTGAWALGVVRDAAARLGPSDTIEDLARAVADGLSAIAVIGPASGAASVRIHAQPDGYYRCLLEGAPSADATVFADALDELLSPLWEPRWIIPRRTVGEAPTRWSVAATLMRRVLRRSVGAPMVYHTVPRALARNKERRAAFQHAWHRWVSPGSRLLAATDPRGEAILALRRGDDPFAVETQIRTLWS